MEKYICFHTETIGSDKLLSSFGKNTEYNGHITVFFHNDEVRNVTGIIFDYQFKSFKV